MVQTAVTPKNNHIAYFDYLRIFALFGVIIIHVTAPVWYFQPVGSSAWYIATIYNCLSRFCVPVFFMISGALFLDPARHITIKGLFTKSIKRIVTAFLFWSALYAIAANIADYPVLGKQCLSNMLEGFCLGYTHLWFLWAITGLYIIVPLLRKICESRQLTLYFIVLALFIQFGMYLLTTILTGENLLVKTLSQLRIDFVSGYAGFFMLGHYIHQYGIKKRNRIALYVLAVISVAATVAMVAEQSMASGMPAEGLLGYLSLNTIVQGAAVFTLFMSVFGKQAKSGKGAAVIRKLSGLVFGAYLAHMLVNALYVKFVCETPMAFVPPLSILLQSAVVFAVSIGVSYVFSLVPIAKKYLI